VCKSYSSNGHCSFWGTESYQDTYCTRWIKDPQPRKIPGSKLPPGKFIRKAGESHFPKKTSDRTAGETYLLTKLAPFVVKILKSDDVIKTLASMGQHNIVRNSTLRCKGEFITNNFTGTFDLWGDDYQTSSLCFKPAHKNSWPFTDNELADLLSSLGLDVMRDHISNILGVAGKRTGKSRYFSLSYPFSIGMDMGYLLKRNPYDTAPYDSSFDIMRIRWKEPYQSKGRIKFPKREKQLLARIKEFERQNQKLKSLPQKEQKQRRETIKDQVKITTQGLTASELFKKASALWKGGQLTDPDKAIAYLSKAIRLDSKYAKAYINRGIAWYYKGNYDRAISDYNKAIELNPRYADAYNNRGSAWFDKGNYDRSCHDYQKACELGQCMGLNWARKEGHCK